MPSIILFPGQGSQFVGMGKRVLRAPKVARMFELASQTFNVNLLDMCLNGPKSQLDKTIHTQAAVFVTSLAAIEYLKEKQPRAIDECYATAGFSVGEYASLVLAGSITFEDALKVIKVRAQAMQKASEQVSSGLATAFLTKKSQLKLAMLGARKWCVEEMRMSPEQVECSVANNLFYKCQVVGGNVEALDFLDVNYRQFGIVKMKRLPVSGAFHTSLMRPAEQALKKMLSPSSLGDILLKRPLIKFYSNYDGKECSSTQLIRRNLARQVSNPVKWEQTLNRLYYDENLPSFSAEEGEGVEREIEEEQQLAVGKSPKQSIYREYPDVFECGPGSQSGPILKQINFKGYRTYTHVDV